MVLKFKVHDKCVFFSSFEPGIGRGTDFALLLSIDIYLTSI